MLQDFVDLIIRALNSVLDRVWSDFFMVTLTILVAGYLPSTHAAAAVGSPVTALTVAANSVVKGTAVLVMITVGILMCRGSLRNRLDHLQRPMLDADHEHMATLEAAQLSKPRSNNK